MRDLTPNTIAASQVEKGQEPILLVKVEWPTGTEWYADKDLTLGTIVAKGRILQSSGISSQRKQDWIGMVSSVRVELSDWDGLLKALVEGNAVEYTKVSFWQHFQGLAQSDLSLLFEGYVVGDVEWSEGDRTISLDVETRLKDREVGFALDATDATLQFNESLKHQVDGAHEITYSNPDAVGKAWPLCFGDPVHVPALLIQTAPKGILKYPFSGPRVGTYGPTGIYTEPTPIDDPYFDDRKVYLQDGDGAFFPAGQIDVLIDGYVFRGHFTGDTFNVDEPNVPKYENVFFGERDPNDGDKDYAYIAWLEGTLPIVNHYGLYQDGEGNQQYARVIRQEVYKDRDNFQRCKVEFDRCFFALRSGWFHFLGPGDKLLQVAKHGRQGWEVVTGPTDNFNLPAVGFSHVRQGNPNVHRQMQVVEVLSYVPWKINAGSEMRLWKPTHKDVWAANLVESDAVIAVCAERTNRKGVRVLHKLPATHFAVSQSPLTVVNNDGAHALTPTLITFETPLWELQQGWGEQIYVTLESSIGQNTADQVKWIIDNNSVLPTDSGSFSDVATAIANYPSNWALMSLRNAIALAEEVSFLARLGLRMDQGKAELVYLSEEPTAGYMVDVDHATFGTLRHSISRTEDIYTLLRGRFKTTGFPAKRFEKEMLYKANVDRFGVRRRDIDFFIYDDPGLVKKSLTFWGNRMSNAWRRSTVQAPWDALGLEVFDCAQLDLAEHAPVGKVVVDRVTLEDSQDGVSLDLWLPILAGQQVQSPLAWLDDSGDVAPDDKTLKYLPSPMDVRYGDDESVFHVITRLVAGAEPQQSLGKVTQSPVTADGAGLPPANNDTGNPNTTKDVDATAASQVVRVDIYGKGRDNPPTQTNVAAVCVDPSQPPAKDAPVAVLQVAGRTYVIPVGGGGGGTPARITSTALAGRYNWIETDYLGGPDKSGAAVKQAKESNASVDVGIGSRVTMSDKAAPDGDYRFFFPVKGCS